MNPPRGWPYRFCDIFKEGDVANRFYLIRSGKVVLESADKDEAPMLVQTIGADEVLGWSWLFPPYRWQPTTPPSGWPLSNSWTSSTRSATS